MMEFLIGMAIVLVVKFGITLLDEKIAHEIEEEEKAKVKIPMKKENNNHPCI